MARADASTLGLVGSGKQAWAHLQAVRSVRPIDAAVIWSRDPARAGELALRCRDAGVPARVASSPRAVVEASDIVCTLTPAVDPVLQGAWLRPGQHLNVVGAPPRPDHREIDVETLRRARIVVDDRQVALAESGAVRAALAAGALDEKDLDADLGEVIAGKVVGRSDQDQITLYNSVGVGIQDVAVARLVIDEARRLGLGTEIDLVT